MRFAYVPVPEDRVQEVFELLSRPTPLRRAAADEGLIERMYRESEKPFRGLLEYLADHPDTAISTSRLAKALRLERGTGSLAGMLGAFGRRSANRYEGMMPFETSYNPVRDAKELTMPHEVAEVIRRIRPRRQPRG